MACGRPWLLHWRGESEREREREREREELVTFLGQIPGKVWEYTNTSVTYDMVHDTHDTDDTQERAG